MVTVVLEKSSLSTIGGELKKMRSETESARQKLQSAIGGLNFEVASKKNIASKMNKLNSKLKQQISLSEQYKSAFTTVFDSICETDAKLGARSREVLGGIKIYTEASERSIKEFLIDNKLAKTAAVSGMFLQGESTVKKTKVSFLSKLVNFGETVVDTVSEKAQELYGNVVKAGKATAAWIADKAKEAKESYDNQGAVYKAAQYGKAALKIGKSVVKICGAVSAIAAVASTGVGIPAAIAAASPAMVSIISSGNDFVNGFVDMFYIHEGQYEMVGQTNQLKDYLTNAAGNIGEYIGNREVGEKVGEIVYTGIDIVTFLDGADKMLTSMGKVNTVVTGEYGTSSSFYWDVKKTSFEAIENSKIKFALESDYFARKIMKVSPSSTGNLIYEAGKNVCKLFSKAAELGKEIGSLG